ncbi:MAG: hypothetical protein IKJ13_05785 [Clostridia bacterium]|nr:hypothetical protein [Clostridia bacterium]
MKSVRNIDKNTRKFITISDMSLWEIIDEIMTLSTYEKSFNKVINDALLFGLPELHKRLFDTVEIDGEERKVSVANEYGIDAFYFQLIRLMEESIANQVIIKSILCSLYNERAYQLKGTPVGTKFEKGAFKDTPDYLVKEEAKLLKNAGRK